LAPAPNGVSKLRLKNRTGTARAFVSIDGKSNGHCPEAFKACPHPHAVAAELESNEIGLDG
jgi:hypothetical protein